jgi:hypothetical protein
MKLTLLALALLLPTSVLAMSASSPMQQEQSTTRDYIRNVQVVCINNVRYYRESRKLALAINETTLKPIRCDEYQGL